LAGTVAAATTRALATLAVSAIVAVIVVAPTALTGGGSQDHLDVGGPLGGTHDLNPTLDLLGGAEWLGRRKGQHLHALQADLYLGAEDSAHHPAIRHHFGSHDALGLARTSSAPSPRPVAALTRQLNIYPA
jgi:hypothetical protein